MGVTSSSDTKKPKEKKNKPTRKPSSTTNKVKPLTNSGKKTPTGRTRKEPRKDRSTRASTRSESKRSNKSKDSDSFSIKKLEKLFEKYAAITDEDDESLNEDEMGPAGIAQLLQDIGVDPEGVVSVVVAWHLNAKEPGYFGKEEFVEGLKKLGCDNVDKLKNKVPKFEQELQNESTFKELYRFAFQFSKADKDKRQMDFDTADFMLDLLLGDRPHVKKFRKFIHIQTAYAGLNLDQWTSFLEFIKTIAEDFSNYDANSAWPVLLDEFYEWINDGMPEKNAEEEKDEDDEEI